MDQPARPAQPLQGINVIELGTMITAPLAAMMLADAGASVIKVEPPKGGDPFRSFRNGLYSPNFVAFNHSKRSIQLDLQTDAGRAALTKLIERADVLIENYRPGVFARLGFAPEEVRRINPGVVHCSITGFGASGPYSGRPAFDTIGLALSGIANSQLDPEDPQIVGPTISDYVTGMYACYGILAALYERKETGLGKRVEANLLESSIAVLADYVANFTQLGLSSERLTRTSASQAYAFRCADAKLLAVHLSRPDKFWKGLLAAIERPQWADEPAFANRMARIQNYPALRRALAEVIATRTRDYWTERLEQNDVPFAPINAIPEVCADPQVAHLGTLCTTKHPTEGKVVGVRSPVSFNGVRLDIQAPPTVGEHTAEVLAELGYSEQQIAEFKKAAGI